MRTLERDCEWVCLKFDCDLDSRDFYKDFLDIQINPMAWQIGSKHCDQSAKYSTKGVTSQKGKKFQMHFGSSGAKRKELEGRIPAVNV